MKRNKLSDNVIKISDALSEHLAKEELEQLGYIFSTKALEFDLKKEFSQKTPFCPFNNNHHVIKNGFANGKQRYLCKDCHLKFVESSNSMLGFSKIDLLTWKKIILSMLRNSTSTKQLAQINKISTNTAFYCKLRIFYAVEQLNNKIKLSGEIFADETMITFSAKGQDFENIHRKPRKRGGGNTIKNHLKNEMGVMVAVEKNENGVNRYKIASVITGFGSGSSYRVLNALKDRIEPTEETILITDGAKNYGLLVKQLGIKWERLVSQRKGNKKIPAIKGRYSVQLVNSFHSRLKERFAYSSSVSSKYLKGYLQLFDFSINYSYLDIEEQAKLILKTLLESDVRLTQKELTKRYCLPKYKEQIAKEWKKYFTRKEIKLYSEIKRGAVKKELIEKYQTTYKRMNTLVKKIDELKIEQEILKASLKPDYSHDISQRSWEIYNLYQTGKHTHKELAVKFGCSAQNIGKIIRRINSRPEAYDRKKRPTKNELLKQLKAECYKNKLENTREQHQKIYEEFNVLCAGKSDFTLTEAYNILGQKYKRSVNTIRNIIFEIRKTDANAVWRKKGTKIAIDTCHEFKQHKV